MERKSFIFYRSFAEAIDDLPDNEQLVIYRAIKEYALYGREIELTGTVKSFWTLIKPQITANNRRYKNGCKGGRPQDEDEPIDNQSATKQEPNENENENVNVNVNDNGNGNGNGNEKQPPPLLFIKNKIKEHGFFLDDDRLLERLISGTDPPWFEGRHSFIDFIAQQVQKGYRDKPKRERHRIFRKLLFDAPNLRDEYPQWKSEQEKAAQAAAQNEIIKKARGSPPQKCRCGGELRREGDGDYFVCILCNGFYNFDENLVKWVFFD